MNALGLHPRKFCDRIKFLAVVNILKEYVAVADGLIEQLEIVLVSRGHWILRADRTVSEREGICQSRALFASSVPNM